MGLHYPSQNLLNAQASMRKTVEAAIAIANLLTDLRNTNWMKKRKSI